MAEDRQDTGPEGGAADGGKLDRLEVVAVWGRQWELGGEAKESGDGGVIRGSTSLGSQKAPRKEGA